MARDEPETLTTERTAMRPHRAGTSPSRGPLIGALAGLTLIAACGRGVVPPEPAAETAVAPNVTAARAAGGLRIVNAGDEPLALAVFERDFAARASFAPCIDPGPGCVRLPSGGSIVVPYAQITGYTTEAKAVVVYTWRVVPGRSGGYRAADLRSETVGL